MGSARGAVLLSGVLEAVADQADQQRRCDAAWPMRAVVARVPRSAEAVHARAGHVDVDPGRRGDAVPDDGHAWAGGVGRSEEHTSELKSLMRISYAVFCL